ncbi:Transcription antitermination protein NusB [Candidatus Bealeia paramacronuclearis]|uniref:Transcription antitermination protein NusB n=1 Tax=Candidatus Bealeia paramacronuclearis TaxID=1921001 RepID=A0ABZ2C3E1_9PROT|nr:Transcription antitermination protein NusB [Candidatus Bealeia paramacronuclearis]
MSDQRVSSEKPKASKRSLSRLAAIQAMFQIEQSGDAPSAVIREFLEHRLGQEIDGDHYLRADTTLFANLVRGCSQEITKIDELIAGSLAKDWTLERIESVIRAILRLGTYELKDHLETPTLVIINEYLELTRAFYDHDEEVSFVNGVLDKIAKILRQGMDLREGTSPHKED